MPPRASGSADDGGQEMTVQAGRAEPLLRDRAGAGASGASGSVNEQRDPPTTGCNKGHIFCNVSFLTAVLVLSFWLILYMQPEARECEPLPGAPKTDLQHLIDWNCRRVSGAIKQFGSLLDKESGTAQTEWKVKTARALEDCVKADNMSNTMLERAKFATKAWGDVMMRSRECCNLPGPPFCSSRKSSQFARLLAGLLIGVVPVAIAMLLPLCVSSVKAPDLFFLGRSDRWYDGEETTTGKPLERPSAAATSRGDATLPLWEIGEDGQLSQGGGTRNSTDELTEKLKLLFKDEQAGEASQMYKFVHEFGANDSNLTEDVIIKCFVDLWANFGFQRASVENQLVHFLSLWRCHVMLQMDHSLRKHNPPSEDDLKAHCQQVLSKGLENLYDSLLGGFKEWHAATRDDSLKIAASTNTSGDRLREIIAFLLVWGEAGNLRFMPECLYFILKYLLKEGPLGQEIRQDRNYLVHVVRPMYNTIFYQFYAHVKGGGGKKLLAVHEKHLMADCENYDDWNEFFNNPELLKTQLKEGMPEGQEFTQYDHFPKVDWFKVLSNPEEGKGLKTHRELHSWWGVYRSCHRVYFLHFVLYFFLLWEVCSSNSRSPKNLLAGRSPMVSLCTVGLVVPINHAAIKFSRWFTYGAVLRKQHHVPKILTDWVACMMPVLTYACVRYVDAHGDSWLKHNVADVDWAQLVPYMHFIVCFSLMIWMLLFPGEDADVVRGQDAGKRTPFGRQCLRYAFWISLLFAKCYLARNTLTAIHQAMDDLMISRLGKQAISELPYYAFGPIWDKDIIQWATLWGTGFLCFFADTQFWFIVWCSLWGELISVIQQRRAFEFVWRCASFKDSLSNMPSMFWENVLFEKKDAASTYFPALWNLILKYMLYEDKIDPRGVGNLGYEQSNVEFLDLDQLAAEELKPYTQRPRQPRIMLKAKRCDRILRENAIGDQSWPTNKEVQWRIMTFARNLTYYMPKPFKAPFIPGFSVLVPHYGEEILCKSSGLTETSSEELLKRIDWLAIHYQAEFNAFRERMRAKKRDRDGIKDFGQKWDDWKTHNQWERIREFASMRSQVLLRTVAGLMYYLDALKIRKQLQRWECADSLFRWDPSDVFTCMISMQNYANFDNDFYKDTNFILDRYPKAFQIAFIANQDIDGNVKALEDELAECASDSTKQELETKLEALRKKRSRADQDRVCKTQDRRFYSSLIKLDGQRQSDGKQKPCWTIELPGFPIVGDGKGDNQNHAIVFSRGSIIQVCDMNQGAYFEQMLLVPNVLSEFRGEKPGEEGKLLPRIVGFPEHITSNIGSMGDFAAAAETAFGTILQRTYAFLGGRMHYGHPDMMNKEQMMRQGGVSKAVKTLNLSEDIFAGMDFTLRGKGEIVHVEYFYVSKGRDLGFGTVLTFFAKLALGTGEQVLTRQMTRLGQLLGLPEFLTFYYGHFGFYFNQFLMTKSTQLLLFLWLVVVLDDPEENFHSMGAAARKGTGADAIAKMLGTQYSYLMIMFMIAGTAPYEIQTISVANILEALKNLVSQLLTGSPFYFIFQSKIIGHFLINELTCGGAGYRGTGRGLPVDRRHFIGGSGKAWKKDMETLFKRDETPKLVRFPVGHCTRVPNSADEYKVHTEGTYETMNGVPIKKRMEVGKGPFKRSWYYENCAAKKDTIIKATGGVDGDYIKTNIMGTRIPRITSDSGLYNDWVWKAFADGFLLVLGLILVTIGGGFAIHTSVLWWMIALSFTVISWIFAPFIFNPYQWRWQYVRQDHKLWKAFFFYGEHWVLWYEQEFMGTQVIEIDFLEKDVKDKAGQLKRITWKEELAKQLRAAKVESKHLEGNISMTKWDGSSFAVTLPPRLKPDGEIECDENLDVQRDFPIKCCYVKEGQSYRSDPLSILAQVLFVGTWYTILNLKLHFLTVIYPGDAGVFGHVMKALFPPVVLSGAFCGAVCGYTWCTSSRKNYLQPKYSFFPILVLNALEIAWGLWEMYAVHWTKCVMTGLILKLSLLWTLIALTETLFYLKCLDRVHPVMRMSLKSWLYGHRILMDLVMSSTQLFVISSFGVLSQIRSLFCNECSFSDWLNFRTCIPPQEDDVDLSDNEHEGGHCCCV
eukprot:TRINITY_DN18968_c0_g1_i1.p1 TRINITY_DN18968_c0_g1~~TRINITY_DN18968_c0_g1_i1.p1  ORF type:complete len:2088 (+),score=306.21 TRINITY_DN18968_c0_g1_i1:71-6334(+)